MQITLASNAVPSYGIVGHVGVGHVNSHNGFVQDDSALFPVLLQRIWLAM